MNPTCERCERLEAVLRSMLDAVKRLRVPQTVADAALQCLVFAPLIEAAERLLPEKP